MSRIDIPGTAIISEDQKFRYVLWRHIPCILRHIKPYLFILINPSTATATEDDRTVKKCMSFVKSWYGTSLTICNLFAYRATNPRELLTPGIDIVGPLNDFYLEAEIQKHNLGKIIVGWGNHKLALPRSLRLKELLDGRDVLCLGTNKNSSPKHPLYLRGDTEPHLYDW